MLAIAFRFIMIFLGLIIFVTELDQTISFGSSLAFATGLLLDEVYGYNNIDEMHDTNQGSIFINENEHDITTLNMINQYCLDHVDTILDGGNPVLDLFNSGLISKHFETHTCRVVQTEKNTIDSSLNMFGWYEIDKKNKHNFRALGEEQFREDCLKSNNEYDEFTEELIKNSQDLQKKICETKIDDIKNNQTDLDELYRLDGR